MPQYNLLLPPILLNGAIVSTSPVQLTEADAASLIALGVLSQAIAPDAPPDAEAYSLLAVFNNSGEDVLVGLPNIGKAIATRIIEARPFESLEQVQEASGLKPEAWTKLLEVNQ
jgi:DNA uptake protein ComE-like DNA-binding protein